MREEYSLLMQALERSNEPMPADLEQALQALPPVGTLPSPWTSAVLVGLFSLRARADWVREKLWPALLRGLPPRERWLQLEQPLHGRVPQTTDWIFSLEAVFAFCTFTHQPSGERVVLDVSPNATGDYFFEDFMTSVVPGRGCSRWERWLALDPSPRGTWVAIEELRDGGMIEEIVFAADTDFCGFRLSEEALEYSSIVERYRARWQEADLRLWLSALAGDWLAVCDLLPETVKPALADLVHQRAEECIERREARLLVPSN